MIDKLNELCMWLSHQKGMMSKDYAKDLAKIIVELRQQADRIAELEKQGKPLAWMSPDGKVSQTEGRLFYIPLYTTPQTKPLSDEEIAKEWSKFYPDVFHTHLIYFVRAIEAKVRGTK